MKYTILAAALLMIPGLAPAAEAQVAGAPPEMIKTCESCHGPAGNGTTVLTPRLNGQLSAYIVHRLYELGNLTQNSPHAMAMYDIAHISDSDKAAAANYLSHQTPTAAQPQAGKLGEMGQKLYANGDPANNVPACQSCHGANAEGQGEVPHLAGQHREYLKTQLWGLNFGLRANSIMGPQRDEIEFRSNRCLGGLSGSRLNIDPTARRPRSSTGFYCGSAPNSAYIPRSWALAG